MGLEPINIPRLFEKISVPVRTLERKKVLIVSRVAFSFALWLGFAICDSPCIFAKEIAPRQESIEKITNTIERVRSDGEGFQDTAWAMTYEEVKNVLQKEGLFIEEKENSLFVQKEVADIRAKLQYAFIGGFLSKVFIMFDYDNRAIINYAKLKEMLTAKYGDAKEDEQEIMPGLLKMDCRFFTRGTEIFLYHFIIDKTKNLGLTYISRGMEEVERLIKAESVGKEL